MTGRPNVLARLYLAFLLFFWVLFDAVFAGRVRRLVDGEEATAARRTPAPAGLPRPPEPERLPSPPAARTTAVSPSPSPDPASACRLLSALQREGRLVDFLMEDLSTATDADIGAAVRVVHAGCRKVIQSYFAVEAVWPGEEGAPVVVEEGFDPFRVQLTGDVVGDPPFRGTLRHHGWRVTRTAFPTFAPGHDPFLLAPAEIEVSHAAS